jgi:hypothetical protein
MGQDVLALLDADAALVNIQKGRVDYLVDVANAPRMRARTACLARYLVRRDIIPLVVQQDVFPWLRPHQPPALILMDSYSELTDQRFVRRDGAWSFCSNFGDIHHDDNFRLAFDARGLLAEADLLSAYRRFFAWIRARFGNAPIVFLHFPVKLDPRPRFHSRYERIQEAIDVVVNEFRPFFSISVPEAIVDWPEDMGNTIDFPYHYNHRTYEVIADEVRRLGVLRKPARRV